MISCARVCVRERERESERTQSNVHQIHHPNHSEATRHDSIVGVSLSNHIAARLRGSCIHRCFRMFPPRAATITASLATVVTTTATMRCATALSTLTPYVQARGNTVSSCHVTHTHTQAHTNPTPQHTTQAVKRMTMHTFLTPRYFFLYHTCNTHTRARAGESERERENEREESKGESRVRTRVRERER